MDNDLLSAQEVADILKIARNTVYELIRRGELISSKVGKQVRVDRQEVEAYLNRSKRVDPKTAQTSSQNNMLSRNNSNPLFTQTADDEIKGNELIICGQDISLEILSNHLNTMMETLQVYRSYLGSYNGIYALYQGRVNVATAHLWDGDANEYNSTYIKKMMPGIPALITRIGKRKQGFYVLKDNPKGITGWADLKRKDITIVNREKGSGTRVLLDSRECKSHLSAATTVSRGGADIAIGCEMGSKNILGVEFIPIQTECYDLVIKLSDAEKLPFRAILEIIASDTFKMDLQSLGGYDTTETGKIISESR